MKLLLDIGNTNVAYAFYEKEKFMEGSFVNNKIPLDELIQKIENINNVQIKNIDTFIISSVVPRLTQIFMQYAELNKIKIMEVGKVKTGLHIKIDDPKTVGADLIATAIGAHNNNQDCLIFDFGTALTASFVKNNAFIGGNITLGLGKTAKTLDKSTALLYSTTIGNSKSEIGKSTSQAISNGIYESIKGFIEHNLKVAENNLKNYQVFFTGNDANIFKDVYTKFNFDLNLIFKGLIKIYELNS